MCSVDSMADAEVVAMVKAFKYSTFKAVMRAM
jgi:hypothetical protein